MSTRRPRLTSRVTIPMREEVVVAIDDAANALGITRTEAMREAAQMWLATFHAPLNAADSLYPEWVMRILQDEDLSSDGKITEIASALEGADLTEQDQRLIDRELHRQRIEFSRRKRAGLA